MHDNQLIIKTNKKRQSKLKQLIDKYQKLKQFKEEKFYKANQQESTNPDFLSKKNDLSDSSEFQTIEELSSDNENNNSSNNANNNNHTELLPTHNLKDSFKQQNPKQIPQQSQSLLPLVSEINEYHPQEVYNMMQIRHWVNHIVCPEIDTQVTFLINRLNLMQTVKKLKYPKKYKKRIVAGIKECNRTLDSTLIERQAKCLIMAINIQENPLEGGSDEIYKNMIIQCQKKQIPIIHACSRKKLGLAFTGKQGQKTPKISVLSIINYQSYENAFQQLMQLVEEKKLERQKLLLQNQ